jgi:hypothetical protein
MLVVESSNVPRFAGFWVASEELMRGGQRSRSEQCLIAAKAQRASGVQLAAEFGLCLPGSESALVCHVPTCSSHGQLVADFCVL